MERNKRNLLLTVIAVTVGLAVAAISFYQFVFAGGCIFLSLFNIPCPSCGMTRATFALLRGRVAEALGYHPLVMLPYITAAFGAFCVITKKWRKALIGCLIAFCVAYITVWIVRVAFFGWTG